METTTSFEDWLNENTPVSTSEIYTLWRAVNDQQTQGNWAITRTRAGTIVKGTNQGLILASEAARREFLRKVESFKDDPSIDMEAWWMSKRDRS